MRRSGYLPVYLLQTRQTESKCVSWGELTFDEKSLHTQSAYEWWDFCTLGIHSQRRSSIYLQLYTTHLAPILGGGWPAGGFMARPVSRPHPSLCWPLYTFSTFGLRPYILILGTIGNNRLTWSWNLITKLIYSPYLDFHISGF